MGNRAVIAYVPHGEPVPDTVAEAADQGVVGIYLHWNGGPESIEAFLEAAKGYAIRSDIYGLARLSQIIGNYLEGTLSLGVGPIATLDTDNYDNGTYVVQDWEVVNRWHVPEHARRTRLAFHKDRVREIYSAVRSANDGFF